jgi:hypothetical protein
MTKNSVNGKPHWRRWQRRFQSGAGENIGRKLSKVAKNGEEKKSLKAADILRFGEALENR